MLTRIYHKIIVESFVNATLEHLENSETLRINSWPYLVLRYLVKNHLPDRQFVDNVQKRVLAKWLVHICVR